MTWLKEFKAAVITKNTSKISELIDAMPQFEKVEQMQEVAYLIKEAYTLLETLKDQTRVQMNQIKKNIDFIEATAKEKKNSFDVSY
jgi:tetrahydromethanopterin S-methyltransferase subunit B